MVNTSDKVQNKEGQNFVKEAQTALEPKGLVENLESAGTFISRWEFKGLSKLFGGVFSDVAASLEIGKIDDSEKQKFEKENQLTDKAKIVVNKDGSGAIVLSSSGSGTITHVGKDIEHRGRLPAEVDEGYYKLSYEVERAIESGGIIDPKEKAELEKLAAKLKGVGLVISDDRKSAVLANNEGDSQKIDMASILQDKQEMAKMDSYFTDTDSTTNNPSPPKGRKR